MKCPGHHYQTIVAALKRLRELHPNITPTYYKDNAIGKDHAKRFRWDAFRAAQIEGNTMTWVCNNLYPTMHDTHIDTALRKAVAEVWND